MHTKNKIILFFVLKSNPHQYMFAIGKFTYLNKTAAKINYKHTFEQTDILLELLCMIARVAVIMHRC